MEIYFDPLLSSFKTPIGAAGEGERVLLQFQITDERFYDSAWVILTKDGEFPVWHRMEFDVYSGNLVSFKIGLESLSVGLYFYRFAAVSGSETFSFGRGEDGRARPESEELFQLSVFERGFAPPDWFKGAIMYHIFVDRFFRPVPISLPSGSHRNPVRNRKFHESTTDRPDYLPDENGRILNNDFFGGTLDGIAMKLEYLRSLHVTVLYLSPIFEAASNHKYDTGDYEKIDEGFGGLEAFRRLVAAAHGSGMRIVLDGVFNHTGDDSVYFNRYGEYDGIGAFQNEDSRYSDWYDFRRFPDHYRSWWGIDILPTVRKGSDFEEFIAGAGGVLDRWLGEGVDGFRLDVVDELSASFLERIRDRLKSYPDRLLIGEVWEDASNKCAYGERRRYFLGRELDSVMNYPLRTAILASVRQGNFHILETCVRNLCDHYPKRVLDSLMNMISTHDTPRALTALSRETRGMSRSERSRVILSGSELDEGVRRCRVAAFLQFFLFGNPCVYYGDEIGMQGAEDPFNRGYFEWERTQNGSNDSPEDGFLKLDPLTLASQQGLFPFFKALSALRSSLSCLREGTFRLEFCSQSLFVFSRSSEEQSVLFGVNESEERFRFQKLEIPPKSFRYCVFRS